MLSAKFSSEVSKLSTATAEASLRLIKKYLHSFVEWAWPVIEPDRAFVDNWHIHVLCSELERLTRGDGFNRIIINIPPGSMKSLLVNVLWPAWMWASNPRLRFLKASYSAHLSIRDNLKLRDVVMSPQYQKHFDVTLEDDQNAKTLFKTSEGGWAFATSVNGAGTGEHPNFIIIDDPLTAEQARSEAERASAISWFSRTISTRGVALDARIAVVMQRLHEEDLSGYLLATEGWDHVNFPMRFEPSRQKTDKDAGLVADFRDPRRIPGELLWPAVFTEAKVRQLELDLGVYGCTPAESPVLMADLSMKPISEIVIGDSVIGFAKRERADDKIGRFMLRPSRVTGVQTYHAPVVKMTLDSGEVIRCTKDHKWFIKDRGPSRKMYLPVNPYYYGSTKLARVCASRLPVLSMGDERLAGWLAGFYDREGTVSLNQKHNDGGHRSSAVIQFSQSMGRNLPLCEKLESLLAHFGFSFSIYDRAPVPLRKHGSSEYKTPSRIYILRGNSLPMYQRFLHIVQPLKWRDRIIEGAYGAKFIIGHEGVVDIREDGEETVWALTTETGNYVVWGLASSNSAGQLQQRPAPEGGGLFKREWFKFVDAAPVTARRVRGWDTAGTELGGDWTVGVKISEIDGLFYVEDVVRGQYGPAGVDALILQITKMDGIGCAQREEREGGSAGKAVTGARARTLVGYDYAEVSISGDKVTRAKPFRAQVEAGNVALVRGTWNEEYIRELSIFPSGKHDDQVDASSAAFNAVLLEPEAFNPTAVGMRSATTW